MEDKHQHIDLDTLAEVHRVLASTEFASIEDLAARGGLGSLAGSSAAPVSVPAEAGDDLSPLPRRR
ncbi:MAG: hypothetical protein U0Q07_08265 [Acidimicrobiales bacterium]